MEEGKNKKRGEGRKKGRQKCLIRKMKGENKELRYWSLWRRKETETLRRYRLKGKVGGEGRKREVDGKENEGRRQGAEIEDEVEGKGDSEKMERARSKKVKTR